jgi:hypothetical protein
MHDPYPDAVDLAFVAVMGALLTVGVRTGSFAPLFPMVTRSETPKSYWLGVAVTGIIVFSSLAKLVSLTLRQ